MSGAVPRRHRRVGAVVGSIAIAIAADLAGAGAPGAAAAPHGRPPASLGPLAAPAAAQAGRARPRSTTLPLATLRSRYLAIVAPADSEFAAFRPKLEGLSPAVTPERLHAALRPVAAAIARSGRELYALRAKAPKKVASDLLAVVTSDNTVWQGLEDLDQGWGSRSFDLVAWRSAFDGAIHAADTAGAALRRALGIRP